MPKYNIFVETRKTWPLWIRVKYKIESIPFRIKFFLENIGK